MSAPHSASEQKVDITVGPRGSLELLSQREIDTLTDTAGQTRLYEAVPSVRAGGAEHRQ